MSVIVMTQREIKELNDAAKDALIIGKEIDEVWKKATKGEAIDRDAFWDLRNRAGQAQAVLYNIYHGVYR